MMRGLSRKTKGFSLMELMMAIVIALMAVGLGLKGLTKARTSGNSVGLATAVGAEFRYAREKAIAGGSPVAVVIPASTSRSLFWLEGTTDPVVTRTTNYEGDYPTGALTVATYPGPTYQKNATMPGFKSSAWTNQLDSWLPSEYKNDFVFLFTPNGSVISNDLPAFDGGYSVIVSTGAEVSATGAPGSGPEWVSGDGVYYQLNSAGEPVTVNLTLSGAVEVRKGLLGWNGVGVNNQGAPQAPAAKPPSPEVDYTPKAPSIIFSRITPPAEEVDGQMVHVLDKGEYLTLEVFAQSGDGKPIFAAWNDVPVTKGGDADFKGRFSVPNGDPERMEFYPEFDVDDDGSMEENVWRSVWTWTPPKDAEAGDRYRLNADVSDAKKSFSATIPNIPPVDVAPPGEIVFERMHGGRWHLFTMWADGSRVKRLTEGPHNHRCASATADGKFIAYERDGNEVWVMNSDKSGAFKVANGTVPTISPTGSAIAYMVGGSLTIKRLDSNSGVERVVASSITQVTGAPAPSNRVAWSPGGDWIYYTDPAGGTMLGTKLSYPGDNLIVGATSAGAPITNVISTPQLGGLFADRSGNFVFYHGDQSDPYLGRYVLDTSTPGSPSYGRPLYAGPPNHRVSSGQNEFYPAISPDGRLLLFTQQVGGVSQIFRCPITAFNNSAVETQLTDGAASMRPAWVRQREGF